MSKSINVKKKCDNCNMVYKESELAYIENYGYACEYCREYDIDHLIYDEYIHKWVYDENGYVVIDNDNIVISFETYNTHLELFFHCNICDEYNHTDDAHKLMYHINFYHTGCNRRALWHEDIYVCNNCRNKKYNFVIPNSDGKIECDENGICNNIEQMTISEYVKKYSNQ